MTSAATAEDTFSEPIIWCDSVIDRIAGWWSDARKVSLIKNLFSHRHQQESEATPSIKWPGQSGKEYQYEIYPIDAAFSPLPGNYIYAGQGEDGNWIPVYIAQTRDMHQRLEGHVSIPDAMANGATHIHAHYCSQGQAGRCSEERDLLLLWKPVCNEVTEG